MNRRPESEGPLEPLIGGSTPIFDWSPEYMRLERSVSLILRLRITKMDDTQGIWYTIAFDRQYCVFL